MTEKPEWLRYKTVPVPLIEKPDLDALRELVAEMNEAAWDHHEVAMDDPFKAEAVFEDYGRRFLKLVGYPKRSYFIESA